MKNIYNTKLPKKNNRIFTLLKLIFQFNIKILKQFFLFIVFIFFNSCQYFEKQVPSERELLQKELKSINWKEVDEYPSVADCEKVNDKKQRQQ